MREILRIRDESEIIKQPLHILLYPAFEHILFYFLYFILFFVEIDFHIFLNIIKKD